MSKRARDDASIASLKAILGDISDDIIENLLYRSNNNIETAVNLYFSEPQSAESRPESSLTKIRSVDQTCSEGIRYFIGEMVLTGWSLLKGHSPVQEGDKVVIVRDKVRSSTNKVNKIVRFATTQGREVGRVSSEVASFIAILMDHQLCQFEATIVWSPAILKIGEDMILSIQCYMLPRAMHTNSFMCSVIPQAKKKNSSSNDKLVEEISELRKVALLQLFQTLGMKPVRSAIQRMNINGGDTAYDMIIQTINTKEDDASKEKGEDDPLEDKDEKKEVTDDQLDSIYEKAQVFDSQITPMEQPETMALELKEYQKRALAWMTTKEAYEYDDGDIDMRSMHPLWEEYSFPGEFADNHRFFYFNPYNGELSLEFPEANAQEKGGILADEMGLGKTIEILSLIHANRCRFDNPQQIPKASHMKKCSPTTLIVCPMSLLAQWRDEIIRGSNPDTITVELYYGGDRSNSLSNKLCKWDGSAPDVLITTYGVLMNEWTKKSDVSPSALYKIEFWRIVLDEAHQIKNRLTKTSQACRDIHAKRRWAVTGTPIQNKLDDLYSLVRFLRHEPWANHIFWKTFITVPFEKKDPRALSAVQTVLEPIVLRRTKAMRDRLGQPMVPLPPKTINIEYLAFSREEQDIYDAIYNDSQVKFSYYCEAGQVGRNYASIFQLLTRLRQICCHPYMALQSKDASKEEVSGKGMTLEELIAHKSSQDTSQSVSSEPSSYGLSVLQNMLAKQQASPTEEDTNETSAIPDECPICFESVDAVIVMPCMHMACRPCVMDYFQKKEDEGAAGECPVCRHGPILQNQLLEFAQQQISGPQNKNIRFDIRKAVGGYKPSTKINALVKHLRQNRKEGLKTVVFSQFTSFLDLIGQSLENESIDYTRLDGTQAQAQREKVLATFSKQDGSGASVLLISLRAGGVGLNLTCANRIVMMDPWWNFAIESQAIDRVHRLGQSKEVTVTRFVMKDSVEERILEIQNRKHVLVNELYMSRDESKNRKMDDLQLLFSKSKKI